MLSQAERRLGLAERLAAVIPDGRDASRVIHRLPDILRARMFAIACGYEDAHHPDRRLCASGNFVAAPAWRARPHRRTDLIRERIKSGIAAAKARGKRVGRQPGQRPSDRKAKKVLKLAEASLSYRLIGRHVGLSKNTVGAILQRARAANQ